MATARVIPSIGIVWPINIVYIDATSSLTVSSPGIIIGADDEVNFSNNSQDATINISYAPNPPGPTLYATPTPDIGPGDNYVQSQQSQPPAANGSVNYFVNVVGGPTFGPYSIQVGTGPLYVEVTGGEATPAEVAIPPGGSVKMFSTDRKYGVEWTNTGNPLPKPSPGLIEVYVGVSAPGNGPYSNPTSGGPAGPIFSYQLAPQVKETGKGTVIVQ